ncbi:MAG: TOMM precursor leader peptide-binding protein, partial [Pseudomonadota bacterium]
ADVAVLARGFPFPIVPLSLAAQTVDLALSLAAQALTRCLAGEPPRAIDRAVWTIETTTLSTRRHALPMLPKNEDRDSAGAQPYPTPSALPPTPKQFTADGGHRTCTPEETLARLEDLISPITGIIQGIQKLPTPPQIHAYAATQSWPSQLVRLQSNRVLGHPAGAGGKGQTAVQAKVSCIAEAVERYSCGDHGDGKGVHGRLAGLAPEAIHPNDIMLFSAQQYLHRDTLNKGRESGASYNFVPKPFDPESPVRWTPVWSLTHARPRLVPSALCYFGYSRTRGKAEPDFARTNSNGCAAGNTLTEAILQGLLELIERDACALWWYSRARRPAIDLASFADPFIEQMQARYRDLGRALHVLDLRTDLRIPVAMAVSWREDDGGEIHMGLGCHLEPRMAVSRALTELNQVAYSGLAAAARSQSNAVFDVDHLAWFRSETAETQPYVRPLPDKVVRADALADHASDDITQDIRYCVELLDRAGMETLVLDHTRPDIRFPTARVLVPGLRHFWQRLAPGRLYDVPASLGWVDAKLSEADLNPIPFFL